MIRIIQQNLHETINKFWQTLAKLVERGESLTKLETTITDIEANSKHFAQELSARPYLLTTLCCSFYEYFCCFLCNRSRVKRALSKIP